MGHHSISHLTPVRALLIVFSLLCGALVGCADDESTGANGSDSLATDVRGGLVWYIGEFVEHAAIGGESTGYAIATDDGLHIELELGEKYKRAFQPGRRVLIEGRYREIQGVEIPTRRVLVVETISAPD